MFRRCLFCILDRFFALGKSEASPAAGSRLRPLPRKEAEELVLLAPVMLPNVSAEFCDRIFLLRCFYVSRRFLRRPGTPRPHCLYLALGRQEGVLH